MSKINFRNLLLLVLMLSVAGIASAQCAMCKAAAESSLENGGGIAKGVNNGIIYLMGVPYILLGMFCYIFRQDLARVYHTWRKTEYDVRGSVFKQYRFLFVFFAVLSVLFLVFAYIQLKR
jgi:hypothetical protein